MFSKLILKTWMEQIRVLDTLTLNLNTLQRFSEAIGAKTKPTNQDLQILVKGEAVHNRGKLADVLEAVSDTIDILIRTLEDDEGWHLLSEKSKEAEEACDQLKDIRFLLEQILETQEGWSGFLLWLTFLPESIRRKKDIYRRYMSTLSRLECSISDRIAKESIRIGWKEVMTGKTIPLSELWDGLDAD